MKKVLSLILVLVLLLGWMPRMALTTHAENTAPAKNELEGKTLSILGASMSTYTGISNDASANATIGNNAVYYTEGRHGVYAEDTWWMQVCSDMGLRLLVNNSWSGSSLLHERNGTAGAYVDRCVQLHSNGGEEPDIIAIQMGTNDFQYYKDTLGTADIDYDSLITADGNGAYTYGTPATSLEAAAIVLHKISVRYPNAEVYYLNISQRIDGTDELIRSFNGELKQVVEHFGAHIVDIYGSAITMERFDTYIGDGRVHPNKLGMDAYTEAFKRALTANTACHVDTHTVSLALEGVTADYGDDKIVVDGDTFTVNLSAEDGREPVVTVTMGGADITASAYSGGTVTIGAVTADVTITAEVPAHIPQAYRWEFDGAELVCVEGGNALTKNSGTTTDGVFSNTRYGLEDAVVLSHDQPWVVEWKCEGTFQNTGGSSGARIFSSTDVNAEYNARYLFKSNTNGLIAMGEKTASGSHNYGIALGDHGIDWTALHTYRLENRIADDGSNMVWLYVDGEEIGPMTGYYIGTKDQNAASDWLSGKDFVFPYMGTDTHGFTNCSIAYIQVREDSEPDYTGKTISILGDSISTMGGVSNNTAYNSTIGSNAVYYSAGGTLGRADTWWQQAIDVLGMELLVNNSWSGSCVLHTRSNTVGAYVDRCVQLHNDHTGEEPDVIAVFMGTNDFSYYQSALGTADIDYDLLITDHGDGTYSYATPTTSCEAYAIMLHKIVTRYPQAEVYCMSMLPRRIPVYSGSEVPQPTAFNAELSRIIAHFGCSLVDLENCGITSDPANFDLYMGDKRVHPNAAGMDLMSQALVSAMLGSETKLHSVSGVYTGVASDNPAAAVTEDKGYTAKLSLLPGYSNMQISVTMGDVDITDTACVDGVIRIETVTGNIVITATATRAPLSFRWEYENGELVSEDNALTKLAGNTTDGVFIDTRYQLQITALLLHNQPWVLEWKGSGTGGFMLSEASGASTAPFFFRRAGNYLNAFGDYDGSRYNNYGLALNTTDIDGSALHIYRLENRIAADGTNMVYLYVDGIEIGAMNNYYVGGSAQGTIGDWISGKDFKINYIGTSSHPLTDYALEYLLISEGGHNYTASITAPTCTEQGYTTYTCTGCGASYTSDHTDALSHSYSGTTCALCGAEHPEAAAYTGKVISILGDSISTFAGYIPTADGFNLEHLARYPQDDLLTDVNETWWMQVIAQLDAKLGINDSWRGATLSGGHPVTSGTSGENAAMSNLVRIQNLGSNGTPDVILLYGGTNDLAHVSKVGSFDPSTAPSTVDLTTKKWDNLADGFLHTILRLRHYYPEATILVLLPTYTASYYPEEKLAQGNAVMASICEYYGIPFVDLRQSGVTADLLPDGIHPGEEGMDLITEAVVDVLLDKCSVEPGENVVYSVTHQLTGAESSLGYYKGISHGNPFHAAITGEDLTVTVTMGGVDVTASVYADGVITIPSVTGALVITATGKQRPIYADYLQQLPEDLCAGTNLWTALEHNKEYYTVNGWGVHSSGKVYSVTIPVTPGDQLWATSFQASGSNGGTINGIRLTWFDQTDVLRSMDADSVYTEFSTKGCITAPEGAVAVNVVMWTGDDSNELYILNAGHNYNSVTTAPTCIEQGYITHTCACGNSFVDGYVDATGHSYGNWTVVTEATCTEDGKERRDCGNCDHYETRVIDAKGHNYTSVVTAPTCTEGGYTTHTCPCGDSYVDSYVNATGHSYGEWTVVTEATCTEDGQERRNCGNCDNFETRTIDAKGHDYTSVVTPPTCTERGYTTYTCACGDSYVDSYVEATGHSYGNWTVVTEATCTEDGQERRDCGNCDHYETRTIDAKGHDYTSVVTPPTCTEQGYTTHTCPCGDSHVDSYVEANGHSYGEWTVVTEATCTEDGQERRDCGNCDHHETRVIDAKGHDYRSVVTAPTCTEQGYTTYTCHCGDSYVDSYVNATGHSYGEWIVVTEATCTEDGQERRDCGNCDHYENRVIDAKGHDYRSVVTAPTCTEQGYTTHTCTECGDSYVDSYVNATGHSYSDWTVVTEATCTENGQERRDCGDCDHYEIRTIDAKGHDYRSVVTAPTCTEGGYTTHICACGDSYVDSYVNATGHSYGEWTVAVEATCTENGQERRDCGDCDHYETRVIDAKGHNYTSVVTPPTCTEPGYTTHTCHCGDFYVDSYSPAIGHRWNEGVVTKEPTETETGTCVYTCTVCGAINTVTLPTIDHVHKYDAVVTDPTCTEQGYTTHVCTGCGHSYVDSYVEATGHSYSDWTVVTEAICTENGQERRDCGNCDHYETRVVDAKGHNYTSVVTPPTCTEQGYTTHTCTVCGDSYVDSYVNATGHSYGNWSVVTEATCTEDGQERRDCGNCDHYETRTIDAKGHDYTSVVTPPTCTEQGYTTHTCACGDSYVDTYVEAKGHSYGEWTVVTEATCTEDGQERRDCGNCDHHETRTIDAKGHNYTSVVTPPTCTEQGYTTHTCTICGDRYVDSYVEATGHDYVDGICSACGHKAILLGDVNEDGEIDILDANLVVAWYNEVRELEDDQLLAADVNGDGEVDIMDANMIVAYYNEVIDAFPAK